MDNHIFTSISISLLISVIATWVIPGTSQPYLVTIPGTSQPFTSCACGWWMGGDLQFGSYSLCPSGSKCLHLHYGSMGYADFNCSGGYYDYRIEGIPEPTAQPTLQPSSSTEEPSNAPTKAPSFEPSKAPSFEPSKSPTIEPTTNQSTPHATEDYPDGGGA
eukprot:231908_1